MKHRIPSIVLAALVLLAPAAHAWNAIGHMAVSKLAYDRLDDSEKTRLFTILKSHPHYDAFLAAGRPAEVSEVEWVILRASVWPDWVRPRDKDARGTSVTRYHRGEEHYINIPFIDPKDADFFKGKPLVSPDLANIISALKQRCNDLKTRTAVAEDQAVAICWIFHLVGDIHQPMHNVAYFSSDAAFVQGDQGGNKFGIRVNGKKVKLHAYWDDLLGEDANYADDSGDRQARIYKQAVAVAESLRGLPLSDADKESLEKNKTFASWSQESYRLATKVSYQKTDGSGILERVEAKFKGPIADSAPEAGAKYAQTARAVAEVRVLLAGHRLAERIKLTLPK
jgi:hypothetical protein